MPIEQARALSERLFEAAEYLHAGGFHNQAVARAYYAFYTILVFWAKRQHLYAWPVNQAGTMIGHLPHRQTPDFTDYAFASAGLATTRALQPPNATDAATQLKDQRMLADYRSAIEVPERTARRMISNARELWGVIMGEARKVEDAPPIF